MSNDLLTEALVQEYISLRSEILSRVQNQFAIIAANITLFAAIITIFYSILTIKNLTVLLLFPSISFIISWLYFEQDLCIAQAAKYLHTKLRPTILSRLKGSETSNSDVLNWEAFRNKLLFGSLENRRFMKTMIAFRLAATLGPGIAIIATSTFLIADSNTNIFDVSWINWLIFATDLCGLSFSILTYAKIERLYKEIPVPIDL